MSFGAIFMQKYLLKAHFKSSIFTLLSHFKKILATFGSIPICCFQAILLARWKKSFSWVPFREMVFEGAFEAKTQSA